MDNTKFEIAFDHDLGYYRLNPLPTQEELDEYYKNQYFKQIEGEKRAPEIRRQMAGGEIARAELEWLENTLFNDINDKLKELCNPIYSLLDVGSGTGAFMRYMQKQGWDTTGVEPSVDGKEATDSDLLVHNMTLDEFSKKEDNKYDAITMLNVLEHVLHPEQVLRMAWERMTNNSVLCIRVPNDFSKLQQMAHDKLGGKMWWASMPDHVNYFGFGSLEKTLRDNGFILLSRTTDFPMELFLLTGQDFTSDPDMGDKCHAQRKQFEMALPDTVRCYIYESLASLRMGRSCIVYAYKSPIMGSSR